MATTDKILIINPNTGEVVEQRDIAAKAENVSVVPAGNITDTNLQDVLEDMDSRIGQGGGSTPSSASSVSYDNTDSELEADNVQEAIDEVVAIAKTAASSPSGVPTAFERNRGRGSVLFSQGSYFTMSGGKTYQLPQFLVITDNHGTLQCVKNAFSMANGFESIVGTLQLGDLCQSVYSQDYAAEFAGLFGTKPVYSIIGNHDVGNSDVIANCATQLQLYNSFIKPMVDKGWLASGEYEVGKAYWYHDITYYDKSASAQRKLRIIGVNQYDYPDTEDTISATDNTKFKFVKGRSYIGETQANWLKSVLSSVEENMYVVVLVHQSIFETSASTGKTSLLFCDNTDYNNKYSLQSTDIVYSLLTAWMNKSSGSVSISTNSNANGALDDYTITYDFSSRESTAVLCPVLAGHSHRDRIDVSGDIVQIRSINSGKHDTFGDIYHGRPITNAGVMSGYITDDCVNVVTFDPTNKVVKLCKLGATYTVDGYLRDQEEFNWETLATPVYGDKQVKEKIDALES